MKMGCFDSCMQCLSRIPFATLVAAILSLCGVGVFCGSMYKASEYTLRIFTEVLRIDFPHVTGCSSKVETVSDGIPVDPYINCFIRTDILRNVFIAIAVVMFVIIIAMLIVGFASTGATRAMMYSGPKGRCGGRCALGFFMGLSYFLNFIWLIVTSIIVIMLFIFGVFFGFCKGGIPDQATLDLNPWGFLFGNDTRFGKNHNENFDLDSQELRKLCEQTTDAFPWYIASYCASFAIVLGLIHFLICISANFAHVTNGQKMQEYDDARYLEEQELGNMAKSRLVNEEV